MTQMDKAELSQYKTYENLRYGFRRAVELLNIADVESYTELVGCVEKLDKKDLLRFLKQIQLCYERDYREESINVSLKIDGLLKKERIYLTYEPHLKEMYFVHSTEVPLVGIKTKGIKLISVTKEIEELGMCKENLFAVINTNYKDHEKVDYYGITHMPDKFLVVKSGDSYSNVYKTTEIEQLPHVYCVLQNLDKLNDLEQE